VSTHHITTWSELAADKAFRRARRRAARRARLAVFDETRRSGPRFGAGVREIPLDAIKGTTEPNRAAQFDADFRPAKLTRSRWESVWHACQRGAALPPISVIRFGDVYAIRDGHHRVSVAKALGAPSIRAIVAG
jgi:hypothetical protein